MGVRQVVEEVADEGFWEWKEVGSSRSESRRVSSVEQVD